ncbi:hypothetical protein FB563_6234 [Streptomyces puniciscabiei]|uniref:Uncharacterized protein n=1 Tax=Streptomyces puniciscabiei TaxID=164348 RepID=A0A542TH21_9ACTN|nr:hypothetical protein [Streptomyces puniciscabiei]TQK86141.1 hypothetical protein FB563_6234 [Streptomyces puniciscabiei]
MPITLTLVGALGAAFLTGFREAIGVAVALVGAHLAADIVVQPSPLGTSSAIRYGSATGPARTDHCNCSLPRERRPCVQ